ncbi:hypothetical protein DFH11DRAFT_1726721 [Phellopilus nigrolimitatus]|nr:hypothetical protein DFH11DRAFT_1726721 [Phellopilus nigrolimitatus]
MASTTEPPSPSPQGADDIKPIVAEQPRSTGNRWTDFKLAARRISLKDDLKHIGEVPCARSSLLMGIGAGAGIGVVRGFNSKPFVAANWAMGTFLLVSVGAWNVCRSSIQREREQVRVVVEQMAQRKMRRADQDGKVDGDQAGKS